MNGWKFKFVLPEECGLSRTYEDRLYCEARARDLEAHALEYRSLASECDAVPASSLRRQAEDIRGDDPLTAAMVEAVACALGRLTPGEILEMLEATKAGRRAWRER